MGTGTATSSTPSATGVYAVRLSTVFILVAYIGSAVLSYGGIWASDYAFQQRLCRKSPVTCSRSETIEDARRGQISAIYISIIPVAGITAAIVISAGFYHGLRYSGTDEADFEFQKE